MHELKRRNPSGLVMLLALLALLGCSANQSLKVSPDGTVDCGRKEDLSQELAKVLSPLAGLLNGQAGPEPKPSEVSKEALAALAENLAVISGTSSLTDDPEDTAKIAKAIVDAKARIAEAEAKAKTAEAFAKVAEAKAKIAEAEARKEIATAAVGACAKMFAKRGLLHR